MIKICFRNKKLDWHRLNGPTYIDTRGYRQYCVNGLWHREDGPAVVRPNGKHDYWINYKYYTEKQYYQKINIK